MRWSVVGVWFWAAASFGSEPSSSVTMQVDLHLDTPSQVVLYDKKLDDVTGLEAGVHQLRSGGTNLAVMVLWPGKAGVNHRERMFALLERMEAEIARLDRVVLVRSPEEARRAAADDRLGVVFALEGTHGLGPEWRDDLLLLHQRGLAMVGLTWSTSNRFAGSSGDGGGGLTQEGQELVSFAQELGLIIDVSHASDSATAEVCRQSKAPIVASHSNARAVQAHPRNLSDSLISCISATGGVVGLNFHGPFVADRPDVSGVARHAAHIARHGGSGAVALGSDYDGWIQVPEGLPHAGSLSLLWKTLSANGLTEEHLTALKGENFLRVWQTSLDRASR